MKVLPAALLLAVIPLLSVGLCRGEQSTTVTLEEKLPRFFRHYYMTGSSYVAFCPDHRYSVISREHMFVREEDAGTWSREEGGVVKLTSERQYQNLNSGPFEIRYLDRETSDRLTTLSLALERLLAESGETTMTGRQFSDRLHSRGARLPFLETDPERHSVTTTEIRTLRNLVDRARSDGLSPAVVSVAPRSYRDMVFLEIFPTNQGLWFRVELPQAERFIREAGGERPPRFVYSEIDEEKYRRETSTTQEFLYHPHLNANRKVTTVTVCGEPPG